MCQEPNYPQFQREPQKKVMTVGLYYQIILFFVACRARTENKKKREDDTVVCVFQPVAFSSSYFFPTFCSRKGDILHEAHNAKKK